MALDTIVPILYVYIYTPAQRSPSVLHIQVLEAEKN